MTAAWQQRPVSPDGTHHLDAEGRPAYAERFDQVLPFHAPGLAPVRTDTEAWHIDATGEPAYPARFAQTFGFYGGLAAVADDSGWFHITPHGESAYAARHAWCGNVQHGRVTVRRLDGRYQHLTPDGAPVGTATWRYAGDFRERSAVVQRDDGLHSHVDPHGKVLHGRWFVDLDVFHKGAARARDTRGWTHVDASGTPLYAHRFAQVEPFYNGQARVERDDGSLAVIESSGTVLVELRPPRVSPVHALSADLVGFWRTETLAVAARLEIPAMLPATVDAIAARAGLMPSGARRLMRALWELGVVEPHASAWHLTSRGTLLRPDDPRTLAHAAIEYAGPLRAAWRDLLARLQGERVPSTVFRDVANDPTRRAGHHRMLRTYAEEDYAPLVAALTIAPGDRVVDAGGGTGALAALIRRAHPHATVRVLDLPAVAHDTPDGVAGDLFDAWPLQANVVVLARVLHDWPDDDAARILAHAHAAMAPAARLYLLEMLLDDHAPSGSLCDLHVLAVTGGQERTLADYDALVRAAGFNPLEVVAEGPIVSLMGAGR